MRSAAAGLVRVADLGKLTIDVTLQLFKTIQLCLFVPHTVTTCPLPPAAGPSMTMSPEGYRAELAAQVRS